MIENPLVRELREASDRFHSRPARERFEFLVKAGIINEKGEVLIRMPEPPEPQTNGVAPASAKPTN